MVITYNIYLYIYEYKTYEKIKFMFYSVCIPGMPQITSADADTDALFPSVKLAVTDAGVSFV